MARQKEIDQRALAEQARIYKMQVEVEKVLRERGAQSSRASTLLQAVMASVWQDRLLEQQGAGTKQFASATNLTGSSSTAP